jgi:hypothetical protein
VLLLLLLLAVVLVVAPIITASIFFCLFDILLLDLYCIEQLLTAGELASTLREALRFLLIVCFAFLFLF